MLTLAEQEQQEAKEKLTITIAVYAETVRYTVKMEQYDSPLHIVSARVCELGITLAQNSMEENSKNLFSC